MKRAILGRALALLGVLVGAADGAPAPAEPSAVVGAAGDIACDPHDKHYHGGTGDAEGCAEQATADLLLAMKPSAVLVLGDEQYPAGGAHDFASSFDATWGRMKAILRPAVGNHEYGTAGAKPYFDYFGPAAGKPGEGWYSFDLNGWHLVALNSNCDHVDCSASGPQVRWLKDDLAAHKSLCTLAFWHHARFSSGFHGDSRSVAPFWDALDAAGADVVLAGHDHHYERFAPQRPDGTPDRARGIREFIVGTGGKSHYPILRRKPNSELQRTDVFGVLKLTLYPGRYAWEFQSTDGTFSDRGEGACH